MPHGGRRGHTIRQLRRRIDEVLVDDQERRKPPPPPISDEHRALRRRIAETCAEIELDPESRDFRGRPLCTPESAETAIRALDLMFAERELLTRAGVNWRLYQRDQTHAATPRDTRANALSLSC